MSFSQKSVHQHTMSMRPMHPAAFYGGWGYDATPQPALNAFGGFPANNSFGNSFNAGFNAGFAGVFNAGFGGAPAPPAHPNVLGNAAVQGWGGGGCNNACGGVACGPNNAVPGYNPYAPFGSLSAPKCSAIES